MSALQDGRGSTLCPRLVSDPMMVDAPDRNSEASTAFNFSPSAETPSEAAPGSKRDGGMLARLIGNAPSFVEAVAKIPALAGADGAVLISGETGTGKELVARAIHSLGPRSSHPFVAVNCDSLVDALFQDELFGHERGASDARSPRQGLLAHASGGTLFLDKIDTLAPRAQIALLRVLQDGCFRPLGSSSERRVNVRFIAATNAELDPIIASGAFRADLYYRLSVFVLPLPPLRERPEDILPLALEFLARGSGLDREPPLLSAAAALALQEHDWPGNVRELENAIERSLHVCRRGIVDVEDLGLSSLHPDGREAGMASTFKSQKRRIFEVFERTYLIRLMIEHGGNVSRAARAAGKERRDLGKLLKRHGLGARQFTPK